MPTFMVNNFMLELLVNTKRSEKINKYEYWQNRHMRSVYKVSSHIIWKIETLIEEDRRYKKHCTWDNDASVPFPVGTLRPHVVLPVTISCPADVKRHREKMGIYKPRREAWSRSVPRSPQKEPALPYFRVSSMVWNLFPFKSHFSFGRSQKSKGTNSGL